MNLKNRNTLWMIGGSLIFLVSLYFIAQNLRDVEAVIRNAGAAGPLAAVILFCIFALTPIPAEPLTLFCIYFFGPISGSLITWIGGVCAALVEYNFGLHMRKIANIEKTIQKLPFGLNKMPIDSPYFLIFGRLIPGYGGKIISLVAGIHHVPIKRYLWTTALTTFLGSVLLAFGGYHLLRFLKH
jgi:uncharacterized membrane protein YdjX (TVP38/TMEM64 family)